MFIQFSSKPNCIRELEDFVKGLAEKHKIRPDLYPNILISLTEAVNNAIRHGNDQDENKMVFVQLRKENGALLFSVSDEGLGFDYTDLPDPTAPENLIEIGGRGVFLMRALADEIQYRNNGSTVELMFRL